MNSSAALQPQGQTILIMGDPAALGSLVAGIAHELNTPIGNGLMAASTLADRTGALTDRYAMKRSRKSC